MPISAIDGYPESHWRDVKTILSDAVADAGLEGELVSASEDVSIIQKRIIENLYMNPVVVCDVSGRNPNVMFELGMRLAFDKPTIIVKDDATPYSFDTGLIEHLQYRRDLRFRDIVEFKGLLTAKVVALMKRSTDGAFSPFLANIGPIKAVKLDTQAVSPTEHAVDDLRGMFQETQMMVRRVLDEFRYARRSDAELHMQSGTSLSSVIDRLTDAIKSGLLPMDGLSESEQIALSRDYLAKFMPESRYPSSFVLQAVRRASAKAKASGES